MNRPVDLCVCRDVDDGAVEHQRGIERGEGGVIERRDRAESVDRGRARCVSSPGLFSYPLKGGAEPGDLDSVGGFKAGELGCEAAIEENDLGPAGAELERCERVAVEAAAGRCEMEVV